MGHLTVERVPNQSTYERYAVYYAPQPHSALGRLGERWLGLCAQTGARHSAPNRFVAGPRRYGFHATLKAPMRLARNVAECDLLGSVESLAGLLQPVNLGTLEPRRLGGFLALMQANGNHDEVSSLAWSCVRSLDHLRASLTPEDLARRPGLTGIEKDNLLQWGYPYVADQFRFHMTLTSALGDDLLDEAQTAFLEAAGNVLDEPVILDALSVYGDPGAPDTFRLIDRFALTA